MKIYMNTYVRNTNIIYMNLNLDSGAKVIQFQSYKSRLVNNNIHLIK